MFTLNLKDDIEEYGGNLNFTTTFYVSYGELCFPDNLWTDFSGAVVLMWCDEVIAANKKCNDFFELRFMDGPYVIACTKYSSKVNMLCNRDMSPDKPDVCILELTIPYFELIDALIAGIESVSNLSAQWCKDPKTSQRLNMAHENLLMIASQSHNDI